MSTLHIANTFFESELEANREHTLYEAFHIHPIFLQLQFLPTLYARSSDKILLSDFPFQSDFTSQFILVGQDVKEIDRIETWGPSRWIAKWANENDLPYEIPQWDLILKLNSKEFCFYQTPRLPYAQLLFDESSALKWINSFPGTKVLKSCFGLSGTGHFIVANDTPNLSKFLRKEFDQDRPVIAEPWVERLLDFSTQWEISTQGVIHYLGATICKNDDKGKYLFSRVGKEQDLFQAYLNFLNDHKKQALSILEKSAALGFFGNVGFDAMIYIEQENRHAVLHPIVEINARKTMGWTALQYQKLHFPNHILEFSYSKNKKGLLPESIIDNRGKIIHFSRNLQVSKLF